MNAVEEESEKEIERERADKLFQNWPPNPQLKPNTFIQRSHTTTTTTTTVWGRKKEKRENPKICVRISLFFPGA